MLRQTLTLRHGLTVLVHTYGTLGLEADTRYVLSQCQATRRWSLGSTPAEFLLLRALRFFLTTLWP